MREFVAAFHRRDYLAVFLILHPTGQLVFQQFVNLLQMSVLFNSAKEKEVLADVPQVAKGIFSAEHLDLAGLFDEIMLAAERHSALLIDLRRGAVRIRSREAAVDPSGNSVVDVLAEVEGIPGVTKFRTKQSPSGRWRVLQVITAGAQLRPGIWITSSPP